MNILHLMPYPPWPIRFGGAIRCHHLLRSLARGHDVDVIAFGDPESLPSVYRGMGAGTWKFRLVPPPPINRIRRIGQAYSVVSGRSFFTLSTRSRRMKRMVEAALDRKAYDAVQSEFYVMASYAPRDGGMLRIVDAHNVEYDNQRRIWRQTGGGLRRLYYRSNAGRIRREELAAYRAQDHILCTSDRDGAILDLDVPGVGKTVIPNGVDTGYFCSSGEVPERHSLVFVGMMGYAPNRDGALYFLDEVFPLVRRRIPDAKIYIVGSHPPADLRARASADVIVTGAVDDVRPYMRRAAVSIVPLHSGGGTRLKVLESMALGKPVVATSVGCEGIDVTHGDHLFIEDDPQAFAERIVELLLNGRLRHRLIRNARELVTERYDWAVIGRRVLETYERLLSRERAPSRRIPAREVSTAVSGKSVHDHEPAAYS